MKKGVRAWVEPSGRNKVSDAHSLDRTWKGSNSENHHNAFRRDWKDRSEFEEKQEIWWTDNMRYDFRRPWKSGGSI